MKYLTFCVPCYNSAAYMDHCLSTLLTGGDDVEIIIVDDGSQKDNTLEIAKKYEKDYPTIVKVIHQENSGHGEGVNQGIRNATGLYYKVVDSDDWVNESSLQKVLAKIKEFYAKNNLIDVIMCNYVYEYASTGKTKVVKYKNVFPVDKEFTFSEAKRFNKSQFIAMHTVFYRTQLLRDINLELPKHTFYVDNIFVYVPLSYVKSFYYMDEDFYRYFVGRADQSINESVIMKRIDQHIKITKILIDSCDIQKVKKSNPKLAKYLVNYVSIMMAICSIYLIKMGDKESLAKKKELWEYLNKKDKAVCKQCKQKIEGLSSTNSKPAMLICKAIYNIARKIVKFN